MDIYHIWCDLKAGTGDIAFCEHLTRYLGALEQAGSIAGFRITRRKLGLGLEGLGEFHVMVEVEDLAQLDDAFRRVATRAGDIETFHHAVNSLVDNARFALYRDFPDAVRRRGEEKF